MSIIPGMFGTLHILWNSFIMVLQELRVNKLRTFLSLLGITIGIFCIIAVLTVTGSLEANVRNEVQSLGANVIYVQKWPWGGGGDYPWWKYANRPRPDYQEFREIQQRVGGASAFCYSYSISNREVDYGDDYMQGVTIQAVTQDFNKIQNLAIGLGRYFTPAETKGSGSVIVLGANIWEGLFGTQEIAVGKTVVVSGKRLKVIGTLKKYGSSLIDAYDFDNTVLIPYFTAREIVNDKSGYVDPQIMVQARSDIGVPELKDELRAAMRAIRRLKPVQEDNFSLNELSMVSDRLDEVFGSITAGGWLIGGFALIVGAFGIANIMFVSVKERTNVIGLKKAIGARRSVILLEFLLESVLLCVIGGIMGILLVFIGTRLASNAFSYTIYLSMQNFIIGMMVSVITGVAAGYIPAYFASKLDPVVAIRS